MSARRSWHARSTILATAAAALVAALLPTVGAHAAAPLPAPTHVTASVTSTFAPPCDPTFCGDPGLLILQNTAFTLHVSLTDDTGAAAAFNKDTKLALTTRHPDGTATTGKLNLPTITVPGGSSTATLDTLSFSPYENDVVVRVTANVKKSSFFGDTSAFTVLQTLEPVTQPTGSFQHGIGPDDCATVSSANPVCGILLLPNGANSDLLLSSGSCDGVGCNTKGIVTQFIGNIHGLYGPTNPATLIIKCYRTVCGRGGVSQLLGVAASSQDNGPLVTAPPCPGKNDLGNLPFCTDQIQNVRLNADDSLIYILFADDFRGSY